MQTRGNHNINIKDNKNSVTWEDDWIDGDEGDSKDIQKDGNFNFEKNNQSSNQSNKPNINGPKQDYIPPLSQNKKVEKSTPEAA